jgi:hypothetical protein
MNIFEMHIGVNLGVQKIASHINGDLLPEEIDYYLNNSIDDYIKQQYSIIKNKSEDLKSQYVTENLRTLIKTIDLQNPENYVFIPNSKSFNLPADYKYLISSRIIHDGGKLRNTKLLEPQAIDRYIKTITNQPLFREFPIFIENSKVVVISDYTNPFNDVIFYITYIKEPSKVKLELIDGAYNSATSVNSDLPSHTHQEIVNITVNKILLDLNRTKPE